MEVKRLEGKKWENNVDMNVMSSENKLKKSQRRNRKIQEITFQKCGNQDLKA